MTVSRVACDYPNDFYPARNPPGKTLIGNEYLGSSHSGVLNALLGDGTVHSVSKDALPLVLTQLARTADGNVVVLP